jgi:rod shape determining protein RodA
MHDYQKARVMTFVNPEADPLGSGYHIMQSKIALGSGGFFGKGYLQGTQSHLNFLPEMQTDFIFTMIAEEFGMSGAIIVIFLYLLLILYGYLLGFNATSQFGRLLGIGLSTNLFLYMFINIGMVIGILPVVGVPIPLLSYGGTSMLAVMIGFGLMLSLQVHQDVRIPLRGTG